MMLDVIVIGGGVIGGMILRELTKYELRVALAEKQSDVAMGQSRANSGIVHAGFDAQPGTAKARFNLLGSRMMPEIARELGVKYQNNGSLVVAFSEKELSHLKELLHRGEQNGVAGLKILTKEELVSLEPNVGDEAIAALYAPSGGIICPYGLTIAAIGNAMDNGAELCLGFAPCEIKPLPSGYRIVATDGRTLEARCIVNAAGGGCKEIAALFGDELEIGHRRGEYLLLDRTAGRHVSHTLFSAPSERGKGVLVSPTVDGNLLLGPTATVTEAEDVETTEPGMSEIREKAARLARGLPLRDVITSFAGSRAFHPSHDFYLRESDRAPGVYHCAGVESPGLTASPAIAEYVVRELIGSRLPLKKNPAFCGKRSSEASFRELSPEEKNEVIRRDARYGTVVCRCERVTEGEIVRAITENPPAVTVDAVKRRTRAGMGRCQGGFCQVQVAAIIARELGVPIEEVTKSGGDSYLVVGRTK